MSEAVIIDSIRTPIGNLNGSLTTVRPDDLAAAVLAALISRSQLDPAKIDEVYLGCANQAGEDNRNVARMALLLAGPSRTGEGEHHHHQHQDQCDDVQVGQQPAFLFRLGARLDVPAAVAADGGGHAGGVRLVGYAARGQSAGIHLGVPSATLTVINAAMLPKYKVCRMRPV